MRTMLKLSIRSLTNNKLRFSLTTFAVILGVSFVVASFVLTDGLTRTFDTLVECDVLAARAALARRMEACVPRVGAEGRHGPQLQERAGLQDRGAALDRDHDGSVLNDSRDTDYFVWAVRTAP